MVLDFGLIKSGLFSNSELTGTGLGGDPQQTVIGNGLKFLEELSGTDAASFTFTGLTGSRYMMMLELDVSDSTREISTVINGVVGVLNQYQHLSHASTTVTGAGNTATSRIVIIDSTVGAGVVHGQLLFSIPRIGASLFPSVDFQMGHASVAAGYKCYTGSGRVMTSATTFSTIKIQINGGDMTGRLRLYEIL